MATPQFVSYDRWHEAHQAVLDRLTGLERFQNELRGAESEHTAMYDRIRALEQTGRNHVAGERTIRDRAWLFLIAIMSGLVFPLLAGAIITFLHLRS